MTDWECLKCKHKWIDESKFDPRFCPLCGTQMIIKVGAVAGSIQKGLKRYEHN